MRITAALSTVTARLGLLVRVQTSDAIAALTFDDGPDATFTPLVLDALVLAA